MIDIITCIIKNNFLIIMTNLINTLQHLDSITYKIITRLDTTSLINLTATCKTLSGALCGHLSARKAQIAAIKAARGTINTYIKEHIQYMCIGDKDIGASTSHIINNNSQDAFIYAEYMDSIRKTTEIYKYNTPSDILTMFAYSSISSPIITIKSYPYINNVAVQYNWRLISELDGLKRSYRMQKLNIPEDAIKQYILKFGAP
jgi:hypothetical protein